MPEEIYETTVRVARPITVPLYSFPSESAREIHEYVEEQNANEEVLAEEQDTHVSVW